MYCIKCGKEIIKGSDFCLYCGARISDEGKEQPAAAQLNTAHTPKQAAEQPIKKKPKLSVIIAAAVFVVLLTAGAFLLFGKAEEPYLFGLNAGMPFEKVVKVLGQDYETVHAAMPSESIFYWDKNRSINEWYSSKKIQAYGIYADSVDKTRIDCDFRDNKLFHYSSLFYLHTDNADKAKADFSTMKNALEKKYGKAVARDTSMYVHSESIIEEYEIQMNDVAVIFSLYDDSYDGCFSLCIGYTFRTDMTEAETNQD